MALLIAKNNQGVGALIGMAHRGSKLTGPMSMQPAQHQATQASQSPPVDRAKSAQAQARKKRTAAQDAAAAAKAKISRRNSLRKQRRLQKV